MLGLLVIFMTSWLISSARDLQPQCGGILSADSGWFTPTAISSAESNNCLWIIKNQPEKRIKLQITDMDTYKQAYCQVDRIEVEDDNRLLGTFCGNEIVPPIFTQTDHMYVLAFYGWTDAFYFNATYTHVDLAKKQCGGHLLEPVGWFQSFDHDQDHLYDSSLDCIWVLESEPDKRIILHFLYFDVKGEDACQNGDYVEIKDGYDIVGRYCGTSLPPLVVSTSNVMKVRFLTDHQEDGEGFNASFRHISEAALNCGGVLRDQNIQLEIHSSDQARNLGHCVWVIYVDEDKIIELKLTKLQLTGARDCTQENIRVYDDEKVIRKFCGSTRRKFIRSTSNSLFVALKSENIEDIVLKASHSKLYEFSDICGGLVSEPNGRISSPEIDALINAGEISVNCFWVIEGGTNMEIEIEIRILDVNKTVPCKDFLQVYDGYSPRTKYCDKLDIRSPIRSKYNVMYVRLHVTNAMYGGKFRAQYKQKEALSKVCGGVLNDTKGLFESPDYDKNKMTDHNLDCVWKIIAEEHKVVYLWFHEFSLEYSLKCRNDFLRIYQADEEADAVSHCGNMDYNFDMIYFLSETNEVYVHLVTDEAVSLKGFRVYYEQVTDPMAKCESNINETSGWLTPIQHDFLVDKAMNCYYLLRMRPGKVVHFDAFELNIQKTAFCLAEFIEIDETPKLCGKLNLPAFRSRSHTTRIHFKTRSDNKQLGFNITYHQMDGQNTHLEIERLEKSGWLWYPFRLDSKDSFDVSGPYNLNFFWTVICSEEEVVIVTIMSVFLYNHPVVSTETPDQLVIYEPHKTHNVIISGESVTTQRIISEYNELHVDFKTDGWGDQWEGNKYDHETGFLVKYDVIEDVHITCTKQYACLQGNNSIPRDSLCDNFQDCFGADDERFCYSCPVNCTCSRLTVDCTQKNTCDYTNIIYSPHQYRIEFEMFEGVRHLDVSANPFVFRNLNLQKLKLKFLKTLNISFCEISEFPTGFFHSMVALQSLDISYNALKSIASQTFRMQGQLKRLYLEGNTDLISFESMSFSGLLSLENMKLSRLKIQTISEKAFYGLSLQSLEFTLGSINIIHDDAFRDLQVTNIFLNTTRIGEFSNMLFGGVLNVSLLVTDSYMICCIKPFYLSQDSCYPPKPSVQPCHDLLGNERYLLWINGLVAILANLGSIKGRLVSADENVYAGNSYFVSSLGFSNFLFAVYVMTIIGGDTVFRGAYFINRVVWLHGNWCKMSQMLSSFSLLSSVTAMLLITIGRYLVAKYPTGSLSLSKKGSLSLVFGSWIISFLFTLIQLLNDISSDNDVLANYGLCFGPSSNMKQPPTWLIFLVFPLLINVVTIVIIVVSCAQMFKEAGEVRTKAVRGRLNRAKDLSISRNVLLLVFGNVLYLSSVYIFTYIGRNSDVIGHETVTWMTVIIISIMSVLNPFLFNMSIFFDIMIFEPSENEQKRPKLCSKAEFEQLLSLMQSRCFLKPGTRKRGYFCLRRLRSTRKLTHREVAFIACSLVRRLTEFHAKGLVLEKLIEKDVYVKNKLKRRGYGVVMICHTPLLVNAPTDAASNIEDFGIIVNSLVEYLEVSNCCGTTPYKSRERMKSAKAKAISADQHSIVNA